MNNFVKNKKYKGVKSFDYFFEDKIIGIDIDSMLFVINYCCNEFICNFLNRFFLNFLLLNFGNNVNIGYDGIFLIKNMDVDKYLVNFKLI